tara:strand:+ start:2559 stop:3053 length:495 start_codon:yes stop_codon:yes gene_type:complete
MDYIKKIYFNRKEIIREQKKIIISNLINIVLSKNYISKNNIVYWIKSYHYSSPTILTLLILLGNIYIANFILIIIFIIVIAFFYFKSCLISLLEYNLCNDDNNIVDIWVEFFECKKIDYNNNTRDYKINLSNKRFEYTIVIGGIWFITCLLIYYYRFLYNYLHF